MKVNKAFQYAIFTKLTLSNKLTAYTNGSPPGSNLHYCARVFLEVITKFLVTFIIRLAYTWHCATSRKVPGSIPGGVTGDFFRGIRQFHVPGVDSAS
jgi:hypothetical protein